MSEPAPQRSSAALTQALFYLRSAAPQQFEQFVRVYVDHVDKITVAVIDAPAEEVLIHQGIARHARAILRVIADLDQHRPTTQ